MKEVAFVEKITGDRALVSVAKKSACGENCASCKGGCVPGERKLWAKNNMGAEVGDRVVLELDSSRVIYAAFLAYILPVVVFLAVFMALDGFIYSELLLAVIAFLAAGAAVFLVRKINDKSKEKYMPQITKITRKSAD